MSEALIIAQRAVLGQPDRFDQVTMLWLFGIPVVMVTIIIVFNAWRNRRGMRMRELEAIGQQQQHTAQLERDEKVFGQHVSLNDLTARKLELEAQLMQLQLAAATNEQRVREQNDEYHKLMVQKAQLEIQSLKLHIREQLKRNEDFTSYDEE